MLVKNLDNIINENIAPKYQSEPAYKVVVITENHDKLNKVKREIGKISGINFIISDSNFFENFIEVVNNMVNKVNALKILSRKLDIRKEEIIAVGDSENDCTMLKYAGLGIAMGNAKIPVKEISNYITTTNDEDGVYYAVKKFIL
jgi:hypothetical protein